jgi:isoprenylcysteine carboxyl methyltransferase (ICMT) family protein YpbQ
MSLLVFFAIALLFRLATLAVSIKHEKALKREGAIEVGASNSKRLAIAHLLFYFAALAEGLYKAPEFDKVSVIGLCLYVFGMIVLIAVITILGRFWTVKLLIARDHVLVTHPLFRVVRHPNYYLNLLPELIGYALIFHAYLTLLVGLPLYLFPLITRVRQEEAAMSERFSTYKPSN